MAKKKAKDPWKAAIDQLEEYTEGTPPMSIKEYGCPCGHEAHEHEES